MSDVSYTLYVSKDPGRSSGTTTSSNPIGLSNLTAQLMQTAQHLADKWANNLKIIADRFQWSNVSIDSTASNVYPHATCSNDLNGYIAPIISNVKLKKWVHKDR